MLLLSPRTPATCSRSGDDEVHHLPHRGTIGSVDAR
jgi:hypothetical protein